MATKNETQTETENAEAEGEDGKEVGSPGTELEFAL